MAEGSDILDVARPRPEARWVVISGMPTARLLARLLAMATDADIAVIAVDPAYTSKWGAQHWRITNSTATGCRSDLRD